MSQHRNLETVPFLRTFSFPLNVLTICYPRQIFIYHLFVFNMNQTLLAEIPALTLPQGVSSNFVNPPSSKNGCVAAITVMLTIITLAMVGQVVVKVFINKLVQLEG